MNRSILALAGGTFGLGMSEYLMMGILTDIAKDINVSIPRAGHFISAYALGVCVGAPLFAITCRSYPLKKMLLLLAVIFTIGNLGAALASNYQVMLLMRFISGLPHGSFFGAGAIVASKLSDPQKESQAISLMISGMTTANLLGVPMGTCISHLLSWRIILFIIGLLGAFIFLAILKEVPYIKPLESQNFKEQFRFLASPIPWLLIAAIILGNGGIFCWYSYINPFLTQVVGFSPVHMTLLMALAGLGMVVGNYISGKLSDRYSPMQVAFTTQYLVCVILCFIFICARLQWPSLALMFLCTMGLFALSTPQQILLIKHSKNGEMLGAASAQVAFNLGNAIGAYSGGITLLFYNYEYTALIGSVFALIGCLLLFLLKILISNKQKILPENKQPQS